MEDDEVYNQYNQEFDNSNKFQEQTNINNPGQSDIKIGSDVKNSITNDEMTTTIWELEVWKKAEQTKFKAYLKQVEIDYMNKAADEIKKKEDDREKQVKVMMNEFSILQTRLKKKAVELETRENKVFLLEEELKLKVLEVAKQLTNKEQEIKFLEKKIKDERVVFEKEKASFNKIICEKEKENVDLEQAFRNYRKEIDESPLSLMRAEINKKTLEIDETNREKDRLNHEKEKLKQQVEKLKIDMIKIKKVYDNEKEQFFKQKIDEVEKLKFEIFNQKAAQKEMQELSEIRQKVKGNSEIKNKEEEKKSNKEYKIVNTRKTKAKINDEGSNDLEKLINEKNNLLKSGMYNENDALIQKLDIQIRRMIDQN